MMNSSWKLISLYGKSSHHCTGLKFSTYVLSSCVEEAISKNKPVVALESTIITHGMPYPDNFKTATNVESIIKNYGAVPATVAVFGGKVHIGLSHEEIHDLAKNTSEAVKVSRRDLPYVISQKLVGGTTVSATMIAAAAANIPIFVTGGVGGVHRQAESTMDISADLRELGRTNVAVVSAGVKSILDIGRTLEYLETEGVFVATFGESREFPAFFSSKSGHQSPYSVNTAKEAAQCIYSSLSSNNAGGMLFAVPVPDNYAMHGEEIETAIQKAIQEAKHLNIAGKEVTPFLLRRVNELTCGLSLKANIALIENNAKVGAQIAVELSKLRSGIVKASNTFGKCKNDQDTSAIVNKGPVVVGGTNIDINGSFMADDISVKGVTYPGKVTTSFGGVGRNIADCITRLGSKAVFLSAVGQDYYGNMFSQNCDHMDLSHIIRSDANNTATCALMLSSMGDYLCGIGDFAIHACINGTYISENEKVIAEAPVVIVDGNVPRDALEKLAEVCNFHETPLWFEPTDCLLIEKLFHSNAWKSLTYTSPNLKELRRLYDLICGNQNCFIEEELNIESNPLEEIISDVVKMAKTITEFIPILIITLGSHGVLLCHKISNEKFPIKGDKLYYSEEMKTLLYPSILTKEPTVEIKSVSGAGDCLASAIITGAILRNSMDDCVKSGIIAAHYSLRSTEAVPHTISACLINNDIINENISWNPTPIIL